MAYIRTRLSLAIAATLFLSSAASAQSWTKVDSVPAPNAAPRKPSVQALCLPPGASAPVPCGTARAGQTIRLRIATTSLPTGPIRLVFAEEAAAGLAPRRADLTLAPERSRDGAYDVTVPLSLCAAAGDKLGNFEIQHLMSTFSEGEITNHPLGTLTVAC